MWSWRGPWASFQCLFSTQEADSRWEWGWNPLALPLELPRCVSWTHGLGEVPELRFGLSLLQELTAELEEKQDIFRSLQDTAELLSLENHPAKQTVEVSRNLGELWGSQGSDHLSWN